MHDARDFLQKLFKTAVRAANPQYILQKYLPKKPKGRTIIIGAGKGAAQMAKALEDIMDKADYGKIEGVVVTRYGYGDITNTIEIIEASHPVPDENGLKGAQKLINLLQGLTKDDLVIALICGGGSALLPAPLGHLTLQDEIGINEVLLKSGAPISVMNTIRKHLSKIKGGRLAALAYPAKVVSLLVSDIPGDIAAHIASGPTVPDYTTRHDALQFIKNYKISLPKNVMDVLESEEANAPKPDDAVFANHEVHIIASAQKSLEAAAEFAKSMGVEAHILADTIEGEAKDIAMMHGAIARQVLNHNLPFQKPVVLLSGGETTVTMGDIYGKGGRNSEFILSLAINIKGCPRITALAGDTDGVDGSEDNAGAFCDGDTFQKIKEYAGDPQQFLSNHDAWSALAASGELFMTGPTGTNVNDFRAIVIV